jgi:hypothetical protein
MDGSRFDDLAKSFGAQRTRRGMLGALAGAALAAVGFGKAASARTCRSVGNACSTNGDCCSANCVTEGRTRKICRCTADRDCPGGVCLAGDCCIPPADDVTCAGLCGPQTNNCGQPVACAPCCTPTAQSCQTNGQCCSGVCAAGSCAGGAVADGGACDEDGDCLNRHCCAGVCRTLDTDPGNCGACGAVCRIGESCTAGVCTCGSNPRCPIDQQCVSGACTVGCDAVTCAAACGEGAQCFAGPERHYCYPSSGGYDCGQPCNRDAECSRGYACAGTLGSSDLHVLCGSNATGFCAYGLNPCT